MNSSSIRQRLTRSMQIRRDRTRVRKEVLMRMMMMRMRKRMKDGKMMVSRMITSLQHLIKARLIP